MNNNKNTQPVLGKFVRREIGPHRQAPADIVSYDLSVIDTDSGGYNPYDKPAPPPTEAQIDEMARRRVLRKSRK